MLSRVCGHCGVHALFTPYGDVNSVHDEYNSEVVIESVVRCAACRRLSLISVDIYMGSPGSNVSVTKEPERFWAEAGVDTCLPNTDGPEILNLPKPVASAAADAFHCLNSRLLSPAVLMARTTIEATAKAHGIKQGSLMHKIDDMHTKGLILDSTKRAAHAIRTFGNDMAHGDLENDISYRDTRDIVELMQLILREVFELPYLAQKLQHRATVREDSKSSGK